MMTIFWILTVVAVVAVVGFVVLCKISRAQFRRKVEACEKSARVVEEIRESLVEPAFETFLMDQECMSCSPDEAFANRRAGWYFVPSLLGNCEKEDFFMRAIRPSLEVHSWVGVSWKSICDRMLYEAKCERAGKDAPFSAVYVLGPEAVLRTIHALVADGLFRLEKVDGKDVVFPTPALVEKVMGKKPVAVAS